MHPFEQALTNPVSSIAVTLNKIAIIFSKKEYLIYDRKSQSTSFLDRLLHNFSLAVALRSLDFLGARHKFLTYNALRCFLLSKQILDKIKKTTIEMSFYIIIQVDVSTANGLTGLIVISPVV